MIEVTRKELYNKSLDVHIDTTSHQWYIFRDKSVILYIGESRNVLHRARYHRKMDAVCQWHLPYSLEWQVQFLTLEDICQLLTPPQNLDDEDQHSRKFRVKIERALTQEFHPCFDRRVCPGTVLPDYQVPWCIHPGVPEADHITANPEKVMEFFHVKQKVPKLDITTEYLGEVRDIHSLEYGPSLYYGEPGYSATYIRYGIPFPFSLPSNQEFKLYSYRVE